jgi:uncharacterized membrane protein YjfL (UPF0719 family)
MHFIGTTTNGNAWEFRSDAWSSTKNRAPSRGRTLMRWERLYGVLSTKRECPLYSSRGICLGAVVVCSAALVLDVNVPRSFVDYWGTYVFAVSIFVFFYAARRCKRLMERLFYCVCLVYCLILGIESTIPMSGAAHRTCQLLRIALCAVGIALSGSILIWHFRHGSPRAKSGS